jgi:two-component system chemotaxis sensor kinase CheA
VEDLALRLIVGDEGEGDVSIWLPALQRLQECAAQFAAKPVADAAALMAAALTTHGATPTVLQQGIANLQEALSAQENKPAADVCSLAQDRELLLDFIVESREHLAQIETQVLTLERDPCDSEALNSVFRGFHTIKGLGGFLELWDIQKLAHEIEAVLDLARTAQLTITPPAIDIILAGADYLRRWLAHLESDLQGRPSPPPLLPCSLPSERYAMPPR